MAAGAEYRIIAAGRIAFNALRIEKGYRPAGADMTTEHTPDAAGLSFAVKSSKQDFVGKKTLDQRRCTPRLRTIKFDDPAAVVLGKEPVTVDGKVVGYVTSAGWSPTIGACLAYAWLPSDLPDLTAVEVDYLRTSYGALVISDPVVDPEMARIKQ